jgi:hypothetical protein
VSEKGQEASYSKGDKDYMMFLATPQSTDPTQGGLLRLREAESPQTFSHQSLAPFQIIKQEYVGIVRYVLG